MKTSKGPGPDQKDCRSITSGDWGERQVRDLVLSFLRQADRYREIAEANGTPLFIFEPAIMRERIRVFMETFNQHLDRFEAFFAMKCNNHPEVVSTAVQAGMGLDVSSGIELSAALGTGCRRILFSGPGKTQSELEMAAAHADRVTVLLDSFAELEKLSAAGAKAGSVISAGVRIATTETGLWRKFGISPGSLGQFLKTTAASRSVKVQGLQFHSSWNLTPERQTEIIANLGQTLRLIDPALTRSLRFLDIGGGFWPEEGEWKLGGEQPGFPEKTFLRKRDYLQAVPIEEFARWIAQALRTHILPLFPLDILAEPGRWIADKAMHIVISVEDRKSRDLVISDAGTNIIGWERYETDYVPVINLSRPSLTERPCIIAGSLCTPHDLWGWSYFGDDIDTGDILLLPNQGAYTWSLRQQFIKPVAEVVTVKDHVER